jgi:hypothetical protein
MLLDARAPGEVQLKCFDVSGIYSFKRELKTAFYVRSHQQKLILLQLGVVKCKFPFFFVLWRSRRLFHPLFSRGEPVLNTEGVYFRSKIGGPQPEVKINLAMKL